MTEQIPKRRLLTSDVVIIAGCILLVVMGVLPTLFSLDPSPTGQLLAESPMLGYAGRALTVSVFLVIVLLIARLDSAQTRRKVFLYGGFLLLSYLLTDLHYHLRDTQTLQWQVDQYIKIIIGQYDIPHQYRFLPHGVLWWILLLNGDFLFSYLAYRFFFTFVVCLCLYKFSRLYNPHKESLFVVLAYAIFYPLSIRYYYGNILDPMFHSVFILVLMYCQERKFRQVFFLLGLGMFIKETVILAVPCYYLLNIGSLHLASRKVVLKLSCLIGWCLLLFVACRIPFGFRFNFETLNGVPHLMVTSNLGFPPKGFVKLPVSVYTLYLHPVLFIFMWFPALVLYKKFLSRSLFYTSIYLGVTVYLTNLCFGWNYESRNFIPAFCMLVISLAAAFNRSDVLAAEVKK